MGNAVNLKHLYNHNIPAEIEAPHHFNINREDEISLLDLFMVINRRKWILATVLFSSIVAAAAYSFMQKNTYAYTTTIELGAMGSAEGLRPIDSPGNLAAKIEQAYVPLLSSQSNVAGLDVSSPRGSNLVTLTSTSKLEGQATVYAEQHRKLLEMIQQDQQGRLAELGVTQYTRTRILTPAVEQKIDRKSQNLGWMSGMGAILGAMAGIFLVFVAEFFANMRRELRNMQAVGSRQSHGSSSG